MSERLAPAHARDLFERMRGRRVLVVGDVMLDEWVWGSVSRISPEAPVPVVAVADHSFTLGGAANVANNLRAIGAAVGIAGAVGDDPEGERVRALLDGIAVDRSAIVTVGGRPTTRKTRIVAHSQQVVRADWESRAPLDPPDRARMAETVARNQLLWPGPRCGTRSCETPSPTASAMPETTMNCTPCSTAFPLDRNVHIRLRT